MTESATTMASRVQQWVSKLSLGLGNAPNARALLRDELHRRGVADYGPDVGRPPIFLPGCGLAVEVEERGEAWASLDRRLRRIAEHPEVAAILLVTSSRNIRPAAIGTRPLVVARPQSPARRPRHAA